MAEKLTDHEIRKRLIRLRNYERLYPELQRKYESLKQEFRVFKEETERQLRAKDEQIETLLLQVEELKKMVFRVSKRKGHDDEDSFTGSRPPEAEKRPRPPDSYRRPVPPASSVTEVRCFSLSSCPDCGHDLQDFRTAERYTEDIVLPAETLNPFKRTEKHCIKTGYCPVCRRRQSAIPVSQHTVTLGSNIRRFVAYGNVILRLSYDQIKSLCGDLAGIHLSDGEISNILLNESRNLFPHFNTMLKRIRGQPGAHYDETGWKVQKAVQGNHAWVMTGTESEETVFLLGRSRGKGNAEELKGKNGENQVGISDDYGVYRNLFQVHQLCWAHPHRKLRDLKSSGILLPEKREHCRKVYESFAALYDDVRRILKEPFEFHTREKTKTELMKRFEEIASPCPEDPEKLRTLKESLLKQKGSYFICLTVPGIPADNNKAERALRHLVLKRKNSYGSKTQKGADMMNILYSVLLSLWRRRPKNFFSEYSELIQTV